MTARLLSSLLLLTAFGAATASADVVVLTSVKDNTLYVDNGNLSNGAGPTMFAGKTGPFGTGVRRCLVQFDCSVIPAGATVTAAQLRLFMSQSVSGGQTVVLRRVLSSWGEGISDAGPNGGQGAAAENNDATWFHRFHPGTSWTTAGDCGTRSRSFGTSSWCGGP